MENKKVFDAKKTLTTALNVANDCGLKTFKDTFNQMQNHYDIYFLIDDFNNQMHQVMEFCFKTGLAENLGTDNFGKTVYKLSEMSINEALSVIMNSG